MTYRYPHKPIQRFTARQGRPVPPPPPVAVGPEISMLMAAVATLLVVLGTGALVYLVLYLSGC